MPWMIGIDEAGFGPNLGPFVMTSVACRVPARLSEADLWNELRTAVRRPHEPDDGRLLVEDSKQIYSTARGLLELERGVLATLSPWRNCGSVSLAQCIDWLSPASREELAGEVWYTGKSELPASIEAADFVGASERFTRTCIDGEVAWGLVRSVIVCPTRFNQLLDRWDTKGAVLGQALAELVQSNRNPDDEAEPLFFCVDKHGGRNNYAAMLQHALPDSMVIAQRESMACSEYRALGLERNIRFRFQPRADAEHFCVALASMVSKYLRELLMREFNDFWQKHLPDLKPTAGYPGDAARFFEAIQPVCAKLGVSETAMWRRR